MKTSTEITKFYYQADEDVWFSVTYNLSGVPIKSELEYNLLNNKSSSDEKYLKYNTNNLAFSK